MALSSLIPPVRPYRGLRGLDAWGGGGFSAPRDGGTRRHAGLDFAAAVGDAIVAPCAGTISHIGLAYPNTDLASIHLEGGNFAIKLLYVHPSIDTIVGLIVAQGAPIGIAQAVASYWQAVHPERGRMTNHVHEEVRLREDGHVRLVDPAAYTTFPEIA